MNNSSRKHSARKGKKQVESSLVSNSGSMSTSNPAVSLFSKQIADFMRGGNEPIDDQGSSEDEEDSDAKPIPPKTGNQKPKIQAKPRQMSSDEEDEGNDSDDEEEDDDDEDESASNDKKKNGGAQVGAINEMYQKYKKYQELLAKYSNDAGKGAGADEDSSITISKSQ